MPNGNWTQTSASPMTRAVAPDPNRRAVVFGAGIAGLTVAHELGERRFNVWVVEPTLDTDRFSRFGMAIGGMARTQYVAAPEPPLTIPPSAPNTPVSPMAKQPITPTHPRIPVVVFTDNDLDPAQHRLERYASNFLRTDATVLVRGSAGNLRQTVYNRVKSATNQIDGPQDPSIVSIPAGHIALVRLKREARLDFFPNELSARNVYRLDAFLENQTRCGCDAPAISVKISYGDYWDHDRVGQIAQIARDRLVAVDVAPTATLSIATELILSVDTVTVHLLLDSRGALTSEGAGHFKEFLHESRTGDIVEIHVDTSHPSGGAVAQITSNLQTAGAMTFVVGSEVICYPRLDVVENENVVPGEHGFRFFPAYYRHLRNTLRRIPVFETGEGHNPALTDKLSGRTVLDNLVNTPVQALAGSGTNPMAFPRTPLASPIAMFLQFRDLLLERGYDVRDVNQFVLRIVRFMATGSKRRNAEFECVSWWDYLRGFDRGSGTSRYQYSPRFTKDIGDAPRILAAFDAQWGDARSDGNTFVQLLLTNLLQTDFVDQVVNAPTTEAWFEHWQKYLTKYLQVRFVSARVASLVGHPNNGRVTAQLEATDANDDLTEVNSVLADPDAYFVLATDAVEAERLLVELGRKTPQFKGGIVNEIDGFTTRVRPSPLDDLTPPPPRSSLYGDAPWDRFQTLTGIQYYFGNVSGIFDGHVYFMDAPWALSSINQQQFWRLSPIQRGAPYHSVLSADIGRFDDAWMVGAANVIADDVWEQITEALQRYWHLHDSNISIQNLRNVGPKWFHLDSNIVLAGRPQGPQNRSPYLIPMADDWDNRPCDTIWDPGESSCSTRLPPPTPDLWHAPWGGYRVHWGQWLFAGTYLRHFTRMTTMEAANESGRHVVNAILDHLTYSGSASVPSNQQEPCWGWPYHTAGNPLEPHAAYVPTPYGDYCHIWDPEKYELPDFVPMRELDDWLFDQGLPHIWDLTGQEVIPSLISYLPTAHDLGLPSFNDLLHALKPPFTPPTGVRPWQWTP